MLVAVSGLTATTLLGLALGASWRAQDAHRPDALDHPEPTDALERDLLRLLCPGN